MNLFTVVTCVAEFIGGGVVPYYNIDVFRLFQVDSSWMAICIQIAEVINSNLIN